GVYSPDMDAGLGLSVFTETRRLAAPSASARIALVIGNSAYKMPGATLDNPCNDANAMAKSLEQLGFHVRCLLDLSKSEMVDAIGSFIDSLGVEAVNAEAGLIFYAGHGVQIGGENYLVPTDCSITNEFAFAQSSVSLNELIARLETSRKAGLLFLDCCR